MPGAGHARRCWPGSRWCPRRGRADARRPAPRSSPRPSTRSARRRRSRCAQPAGAPGRKDSPIAPNVLRVSRRAARRSRTTRAAPEVVLLDANIDDMSGELGAPLVRRARRGRRGRRLVGADPDEEGPARACRCRRWRRPTRAARSSARSSAIPRRSACAAGGGARRARALVHQGRDAATARCARSSAALDGEVLGAHPEFEDCRRLARARRRSRARGGAAAAAAARAWLTARGKRRVSREASAPRSTPWQGRAGARGRDGREPAPRRRRARRRRARRRIGQPARAAVGSGVRLPGRGQRRARHRPHALCAGPVPAHSPRAGGRRGDDDRRGDANAEVSSSTR